MINLKDYINEDLLRDYYSRVDNTKKTQVKAWLSTNVTKSKGKISTNAFGSAIIVHFKNAVKICIDFTNIPEYVKFNFIDVTGPVILKNKPDNFIDYMMYNEDLPEFQDEQ